MDSDRRHACESTQSVKPFHIMTFFNLQQEHARRRGAIIMLDPRVEAYGTVRDANRRVIEFSFEHMMVVSDLSPPVYSRSMYKTSDSLTLMSPVSFRLITKVFLAISPTIKFRKVGEVKTGLALLVSFYHF